MKTVTLIFLGIAFAFNTTFGQNDDKQKLSIGDHYGGGIIFSIDPSGKHGLIAAPFDQFDKTCWGSDGITNATYMNEGALNTEKIVSFIKKIQWTNCKQPAACLCDTLSLEGFNDWYLPSINELKDMYDKQKFIGGFVAWDYCSSTESTSGSCWNVHFRPKRKIIYRATKYYKIFAVRCIRKF